MKVLVTAGPTREALDPVRFISNRSSGKMGYAVAEAARRAGHEVVLVSGPVCLDAPAGIRRISVVTADEMLAAVKAEFSSCDLCVMAAAVADWKPAAPALRKWKKADGPPCIAWEPTPDILRELAPLRRKDQVVCGFAAETGNPKTEALRKLREKNLDAIAANDVSESGCGFESDSNALTLCLCEGAVHHLPRTSKSECAEWLLRFLQQISVQKKSDGTAENQLTM